MNTAVAADAVIAGCVAATMAGDDDHDQHQQACHCPRHQIHRSQSQEASKYNTHTHTPQSLTTRHSANNLLQKQPTVDV